MTGISIITIIKQAVLYIYITSVGGAGGGVQPRTAGEWKVEMLTKTKLYLESVKQVISPFTGEKILCSQLKVMKVLIRRKK